MAEELVTLTSEEGTTTTASAEVVRYGPNQRLATAAAWIVGGLVLGGACIFVPVLHLFTTWALPLIGIVMGRRSYRVKTRVFTINGPCPKCHETIQLLGGVADEIASSECPECREPIGVAVEAG